jgi:hypothetical protein
MPTYVYMYILYIYEGQLPSSVKWTSKQQIRCLWVHDLVLAVHGMFSKIFTITEFRESFQFCEQGISLMKFSPNFHEISCHETFLVILCCPGLFIKNGRNRHTHTLSRNYLWAYPISCDNPFKALPGSYSFFN